MKPLYLGTFGAGVSAAIIRSTDSYSHNWAGAAISDKDISYVTGEIVVPEPHMPRNADADTEYSATAWVGIDGNKCTSGLLQTGIKVSVQGEARNYSAWYEWLPEYSQNFDLEVTKGDRLRMTVATEGVHGGWAAVENLSAGTVGNHTFENKENALCRTDAEWIIERFDHTDNGETHAVPYANTGAVGFSGASYTADGEKSGLKDAGAISMVAGDGSVATKCSVTGDESLMCMSLN